jgi:GNAT superfamily N-acetyltransferase
MEIRLARSADVAECAALDHSYESEYVWQVQTHIENDRVESIFQRSKLPRPVTVNAPHDGRCLREDWERQECFLVADHLGQVLGYVDMTVQPRQRAGLVNYLAVGRQYRRHSIGTALLKASRMWAEQHSIRVIFVEIQPKNDPGFQLCQQLGFHFCGYNEQLNVSEDIALLFASRLR